MTTLESVKRAFELWRAAKVHSNTPAPLELWDKVSQLLLAHEKSEICKTLGVSTDQIKRHCAPTSVDSAVKPPKTHNNDFVEAISASAPAMSELTLKGKTKSLHISLPTSALCEVLSALGELL